MQKAANYAEINLGGEGHATGSKKHTEVEQIIKRYNDRYKSVRGDLNLMIENNSKVGEFAHKNIRPDIVDFHNHMIYDFKFGYPDMTLEQLNMTPQMINTVKLSVSRQK